MATSSNAGSLSSIYMELKTIIMDAVNDDNRLIGKLFKSLETRVKVKRIYILLGLIAFIALYLVIGYGVRFLSNLLGFIYPAYKSITAIESSESRDDTKWLTYWVVFALFATFEYPIEFILQYIPFYYLMKCIFFAWCYLPVLDGASYIYKKIIRPFFLDIKGDINNSLSRGTAKVVTDAIQGVIKTD